MAGLLHGVATSALPKWMIHDGLRGRPLHADYVKVSTEPRRAWKVRVHMWDAERGGRQHPVWSGYRVSVDNGDTTEEGAPHLHDAAFFWDERRHIQPGEEGAAVMVAGVPSYWTHVRFGQVVRLREGKREVGVAEILDEADPPHLDG